MRLIALFFPALISLLIYTQRQSVELKLELRLLIRYCIYVILVNWSGMSLVTYIIGIRDCRLEYMESWPFFTKYIAIAVFFAWIIPYIEEIVRKNVHVSFRVERRERKVKTGKERK